MIKKDTKSQVLKEFEREFENSSLFDCWDGCKEDLWKWIEKQLTQQKSEIIKEIRKMKADDSWGWEYFFHGQDQCCPGDDYADVYNKALNDMIEQLKK